jgi:hypothetical protein
VRLFTSAPDATIDRQKPAARRVAAIAITTAGAALVVGAAVANQHWLDQHFLPSFFLPRPWYVAMETLVRVAIATLGAGLVLVARRGVVRFTARTAERALHIIAAAVLALAAGELVLRSTILRPAGWLLAEEEPLRRADAHLGWVLTPGRTGRASVGGRIVEYAIDDAGYRVRTVNEPVHSERPAIVFIGESVMFGEGLTWDESVPATVGSMMGIQSANLAVHGYATDQAYLRLERELPHFRQPVAVVSLFMTALFGRNLDQDRPHLGPELVWLAAQRRSRLAALATFVVPYRSEATVARGVGTTRQVLRATADLARTRGARPLVVVPQFGREDPLEQRLRRSIVDESGVPYVLVEIDKSWRLSWDRHPNANAARVIAAAIVERLRREK